MARKRQTGEKYWQLLVSTPIVTRTGEKIGNQMVAYF
jgi:hypothetical protein